MVKISVFKNISEVNSPEFQDLQFHLEGIRDGEWYTIVTECRNILDEEEQKAYKSKMPTTCYSGEFSSRSDVGILTHSGLLAIDLDDVKELSNIKGIISKDRYTLSCFLSVRGRGLRIIIRIDPRKHRESFKGYCEYLYESYGITQVDLNGINVSKPYIVSFDPKCYISYDFDQVPVFKKYPKEKPVKKIDFVHTSNDFESVVKQIIGRGIDIAPDYQDWLKLGFAISHQYGEDGRQFFHEISRQSRKYKFKDCEDQYTHCIKAKGSEPATISTFYYLAKISGVSICTEQTKTIIRTTRNGKKAGLKPVQIIENLKKHSAIEGAEDVVNDIFDNPYYEETSDDEESILFQLELYIESNFSLRMNEVTGYLEQNGTILTQSDLNSIFISAKKFVPKLDYQLMMRLLKSDFIETYNPFFEFFSSDGIAVMLPPIPIDDDIEYYSPLVEKLASTIKNDKPSFTLFFMRKWLVSVVSAAHKVHSPLMLCLLGPPGCGKTEFFRQLLPNGLRAYYTQSKLDKGKDDEILMTENLVIMDDEMSGKNKSDAQKLKNITSTDFFSLRRPYGDHNEKILRLAVLCGTSNYKAVLNDSSVNRRIIPIDVEDIDKNLYNEIDKKELWMEIYRLYKEGFDWRITPKDIPLLNIDQVEYEVTCKERELIERYFEPGEEAWLSTTDVLVELEKLTMQRLNINTIGRELQHLEYKRKSIRDNAFKTPKKWGVNRLDRVEPLQMRNVPVTVGDVKKGDDLPF